MCVARIRMVSAIIVIVNPINSHHINMSYQQIILIGVVVLALVAGAWYVTKTNSTQSDPEMDLSEESTENEMREEDLGSGTGSFFSLMALGENVSCSYSSSDENGSMSGTFYSSGGKFRADNEFITAGGERIVSHAINDGAMLYAWGESSEGTFATRFEATAADSRESQIPQSNNEERALRDIGMGGDVAYECKTWRADQAQFQPPSDIEFLTIEQQIRASLEGLPVSE